jgi:hypothetical protein
MAITLDHGNLIRFSNLQKYETQIAYNIFRV